MTDENRVPHGLRIRDYGADEFDLPHLTGSSTVETEPTPELEPKPKKWQYFLLLALLIGSLWLADIFGFAIPGFLDELISNAVIALIYGYFGYKVTFPKHKN